MVDRVVDRNNRIWVMGLMIAFYRENREYEIVDYCNTVNSYVTYVRLVPGTW